MSRAITVHPRGFTLIELIVAMGMVAILSVSLYASLRIGFRAKDSAERNVEPPRTAELAMEFLRNDIQNAISPPTPTATGSTASSGTTVSGLGNSSSAIVAPPFAGSFVGTAGADGRYDDLIFYSTADSQQHVDGNGDIKQIELTVIQPSGSNDYVLVRRVTSNLLASNTPKADDEVLCRGVVAFNLQYFNGASWSTSWDSTQTQYDNQIPVAVQVVLQLQRPTNSGQTQTYRYTRVFPLPCSAAEFDTNVNPDVPQ